MREPWWLFCADQPFTEACLLQTFELSHHNAERAQLLHWLSRLGSWALVQELISSHPQLLQEAPARSALLQLRQKQNHPNPWLALLQDAEQGPFLQTWRQSWQQESPIAVQLCGGLGDQLEALALLGQPSWRERWTLMLPSPSEPALEPLLRFSDPNQPLPQWQFQGPGRDQMWLSWPALRAVLADAGTEPIPQSHWSHLRQNPARRPWLVVCWRSKLERGELLWAHLRSLPITAIEELYRWLLPWATQRNWTIVDITRYSTHEQGKLQQLPDAAQLQLKGSCLGSLADTAALVCGARLTLSVDTALIHLAHALNAPRWLLLHRHPDARWRQRLQQDGGSDRSQLKVLQQTRQGDWGDVLQQLRVDLYS